MTTLLLVDDEERQVRSMASIIRRNRPSFRVLSCNDGASAWDKIQHEPVDAVITDIRMPYMDGIELIQLIREKKPGIKLVLISGYGQFDYAHEAIRCGVVEYLVKPVGYRDLLQVIGKLEQMLAEHSMMDKSVEIYRDHLWNAYLAGHITELELTELQARAGEDGPGFVLVTDYPEALNAEEVRALRSEMEQCFRKLGRAVFFPENRSRRFFGLIWLRDASHNAADVAAHIKTMLRDLEGPQFPQMNIGISHVHRRLFEEAEFAFKEADLAQKHKFYMKSSPVIRFADISPWHDRNDRMHPFPAARIAEYIRKGDRKHVLHELYAWFRAEDESPRREPEAVKEEVRQHMLALSQLLHVDLPEETRCEITESMKSAIAASVDLVELRYRMKEWLDRLIGAREEGLANRQGLVIRRCQDYLQSHYMEDLSLELLAERYSFNPSYFSNLFRNKTGIRFSDYLLGVRIEKAKQWLLRSNAPIQDIAEKVGFHNSAYFIRMFKRQTGHSPAVFRRLSRGS